MLGAKLSFASLEFFDDLRVDGIKLIANGTKDGKAKEYGWYYSAKKQRW